MIQLNLEEMLDDYQEFYDRPTPIRYDILRLSEDHKKFDGLIRRYWKNLHPLVRDIFTSFANEFQYILSLAKEIENEKDEELNEFRNKMVEKINEMSQSFETIRDDQKIKLADKDDIINQLVNEKNEFIEQISSLNRLNEERNVVISQKTEFINAQKEQIENLHDQISQTTSEFKQQNELINESISNVNNFTSQFELLEKEMRILEEEKHNLVNQHGNLQSKFNKQESEYQKIIEEKDIRIIELKDNIQKIYITTEKSKAEKKATQKLNDALIEKIKILDIDAELLKSDNQKLKKLLKNQVKINKGYHALTLKVIDISSKEKDIVLNKPVINVPKLSEKSKVPNLLSQLNDQNNKVLKSSEEVVIKIDKIENDSELSNTKVLRRETSPKKPIIPFKEKMKRLVSDIPVEKSNSPRKIIERAHLKIPEEDLEAKRVVGTIFDKMDHDELNFKNIMEDFPSAPKDKKSKDKKLKKQKDNSSFA